MLAIIGTVPFESFPLTAGEMHIVDNQLKIGEALLPINRGTAALAAASIKVSEFMNGPTPYGYLVGDTGTGKGSRALYKYLTETLYRTNFRTMVFHYLQPIVHWHSLLQNALKELSEKPFLIADAGYMYIAKMSGHASFYDLFTPDVGELAFLADEKAPHPFYTRGFILHDNNRVPDLISRAYQHNNAAKYMIVKGKIDYLVKNGNILATVNEPSEEALEAIGGTGDTLTGIVSALINSGESIDTAAFKAMTANRLSGHFAHPTPATQVIDIIKQIPNALCSKSKNA